MSSTILPTRSSFSITARKSPREAPNRCIAILRCLKPIWDAKPPMLKFHGVNTYYGELHVLKDVNYEIKKGEIVCLLGGNASGKSTTMKAVLGIVRPKTGNILFEGQAINTLPTAERVQRGIAPGTEARRLFPRMTVLENLELGAYPRRDRENLNEDLERVYALFPRVKE